MPDGVPELTGDAAEAVRRENRVITNILLIIRWCNSQGILWCLESPTTSLIWETSPFVDLFDGAKLSFSECILDMCMHGGSRKKSVKLVHSTRLDSTALRKVCDGSHEHAGFSTTCGIGNSASLAEKRYPQLFCQRVAKMAASALAVRRISPAVAPEVKAAASWQPRRGASHRVPEFKSTPTLICLSPHE